MNILIDYTQIPLKPAGVGIYAYNLVEQLSVIDRHNTYFIVVQKDEKALDALESDHIRLVRVNPKLFRNFFLRLLLEQLFFPFLVLRYKIKVLHSLHYSFPLVSFGARRVITIHDTTYFTVPEMLTAMKRNYLRLFVRLTRYFDSTLICVSQSTHDDYIRAVKVDEKRCVVIPLGKSDMFRPGLNKNEIEQVKNKYHITSPYFLFIGTIEPRKNIKNIVTAFADFCKTNDQYQLVIVGKKGWHYDDLFEQVKNSGIQHRIIFTGYVDEDEKPLLLNGCTVFIYPSLYEGFGIPVLEALACGVPSITSTVSSMPEVAGNAAILVNPFSGQELFDAISLLAGDKVLQNYLINKGLEQAAKFTWHNTALKTLECYERVGR